MPPSGVQFTVQQQEFTEAHTAATKAMPRSRRWMSWSLRILFLSGLGLCLWAILLASVLFFAVGTVYATELVTQKEISVSRALAGHVLVWGTDEPASGVTVELCSADWKTVFTSTKTDEKGHFSLEPPARGKLFYIRVSAPGMNIYELRVRIDKHATQELTIHLSIAT